MSPDQFVLLLAQLALMLACAQVGGQLLRRARQPAVLGEMLAGVVLGPTVFGLVAPDWHSCLFAEAGSAAIVRSGFIKLGMLFFLFMVGLEIDFLALRRHGRTALLIGLAGTALPLAAGVALAYALPDAARPAGVSRLAFALFIGAALANTANPVLARILLDLGLLREPIGVTLMTAAIVDDLVAWSLLAVVVGHFGARGEGAVAIPALGGLVMVAALLVALVVIARMVARPLLRWARRGAWPSGFIGVAVVLVLASAAAAEHLGVHAFLGPLLLGITLTPTPQERDEAYHVLNQFALSFFVPVYFVSMGMSTNFAADFHLAISAWILLVASLSKIASVFAAARMAGLEARESLAVGFGMNARGATGIILAGVGLENGVIDRPIYVALVAMALATSLAAGPAMRWTLRLSRPARGVADSR